MNSNWQLSALTEFPSIYNNSQLETSFINKLHYALSVLEVLCHMDFRYCGEIRFFIIFPSSNCWNSHSLNIKISSMCNIIMIFIY